MLIPTVSGLQYFDFLKKQAKPTHNPESTQADSTSQDLC